MTYAFSLTAGLAVLLLAGCVETGPAPEIVLAPTEMDKASPAYQACRAAIARQVGVKASDVAIFDFVMSEAGTQVRATVAGAEAPWSCLTSNDGVVQQVMYTGSEGAL
ncbi:hypothetical protein SAMN04488103_102548 [Gemmobacter aquatilis]|uniref:Lipoprotein n=1 Tax=Gemmobacter aquatilis TaxID=933059 RepID=A0A1H8CMT6_9RHOB|nr:hypothetical protein [Gemmobacter aquatilis]SEM95588.1 hypothetical protein SAMN04488103_102548 [Gemmobacter aquatilis]